MTAKLTLAAALAAAGLMAASLSATAAPMPNLNLLKGTASAQSHGEKTHGWHRQCRRGLIGYRTCKYF